MFGVPTLAKKIDIQFNPQLQNINTANYKGLIANSCSVVNQFFALGFCTVPYSETVPELFCFHGSPQNDQLSTILQVSPDVICFSAAISACEKAGEWQMAVELLKEMEDITRCWICSGQK